MSDLISLINGGYYTDTSGMAVGDNEQAIRLRTILSGKADLNTDDGMLYKILDMMPKGEQTQDKYEFFLDDLEPQSATVVTGGNASATTIVVGAGEANGVVKNSAVHVIATGETLYLTADPTGGNTLTVSRGFAGTSAQAIATGDKLIFLPTQLAEKALANGGNGVIPTLDYNYVEASSDSFEMSERQFNADMLFGVGTVPREMKRVVTNVNRRINHALVYGKKSAGVSPVGSSDGQVYTTDGFQARAKTHSLNLGGNNGLLEYSVLDGFLAPTFDHSASSGTKTLICGPSLFSAICKVSEDRYKSPMQYEEVLGAKVTTIHTTNGGTVEVMRDRGTFSPQNGNAGSGILVDFAHVRLEEKKGMPMQWRQNIQANDSHARKDEIWGTYAMTMVNEQVMGTIEGAVARY